MSVALVTAMPDESVAVVGSEVVAEVHVAIRARRGQRETHRATLRRQAVSLRLSGATYGEIGEALGVSGEAARKLYRAAIRDAYAAEAAEALELELLRLDAITARWWPSLTDPDDKVADVATKNLIRVMQHRASLLGLERTAVDVTVADPLRIPSGPEVWEALQEYRQRALSGE